MTSGEHKVAFLSAFGSISGRDMVEQAVGGAHTIFALVLVALQKAPEPHVAEPIPGRGFEWCGGRCTTVGN